VIESSGNGTVKTTEYLAFSLEPFPTIGIGDSLVEPVVAISKAMGRPLEDGDIVFVATKIVSIAEARYVDYASVKASAEAHELVEKMGKWSPEFVQLVLDESDGNRFLLTPSGPIIARHRIGYLLSLQAWILPIRTVRGFCLSIRMRLRVDFVTSCATRSEWRSPS
jgi:coenzyme F420-0:L-glutamate ligase/coenzyme F420-1:gamma-L-glutamate ligase